MRKLLLLALVLFTLAACANDEEPTPTPPAVVETPVTVVQEAAVPTATATPIPQQILPPTYTPVPTQPYRALPTVDISESGLFEPFIAGQPRNPINSGTGSGVPVGEGGPQPDGTYIVREGDTLAEIAIACNVSLSALIAANNIADPDKIEKGDVLKIP